MNTLYNVTEIYFTNSPFKGTYKLKKVTLQREGYDITKVRDVIFFLDQSKEVFRLVDEQLCQDISAGAIRL